MDWEPAFVAVGILLGEPPEAVRASLASSTSIGAARLMSRLDAPSREARAQALAHVVSKVAIALEAASLA
jgi:hypothetical protein